MSPAKPRPYRPCVGVMLLDGRGRAFAGRRIGFHQSAWQMPQGGIDAGESPRQAALRELAEETAVEAVEILGESRDWHRYDLPEDVAAKAWRGRYRGQEQKWFAMRFLGTDADIDLDAHDREFQEWRWLPPEDLPALVVPFKRAVYEAILAEFLPLIEAVRAR